MSNAVQTVQAAAVTALQTHPVLSAELTGIYDGPPPRAAFPYISVAESLVSDWSTKTAAGREIRLALTLWEDGEEASRLHILMGHVEDAVAGMARDAAGPWAGLVEFRMRVLAI